MSKIKEQQQKLDCRYKLSENQRMEIISRRINGESQAQLSILFGVHQSTISRIVKEYLQNKPEEETNNE